MNIKEVDDIERYRIYKWSNESIKRIWNTQDINELTNFLKNANSIDRENLLIQLLNNYSWEAYWDYNWSKTSWWWTTPQVQTVYWEFIEKYPHFSGLSLDLGIITHLPEFMEFIKDYNTDKLSCIETKKMFSEKLWFEEVWRWMMLTDEELEDIKIYWIASKFINKSDSTSEKIVQFEANVLSVYCSTLFEVHFHNENYISPIVSVSYNKDIAIAVWRHFWSKNDQRKFYLFKLKIPKIDLISFSKHGIREPSIFQQIKDKTLSILIDNIESEHKWDSTTESYIFWKINPEEIIEITQPNIKTTWWNNKITKS